MKNFIRTIGILICGAIFLWAGIKDLLLGARSNSWPSVQGTVRSVKLMQQSRRFTGTSYVPEVTYTYEVDGIRRTGDRIATDKKTFSSILEASFEMAKYSEKGPVTVLYDPESPETALLEPGAKNSTWLSVGLGAVMLGIGAFSARSMWRKLQNDDYSQPGGQ